MGQPKNRCNRRPFRVPRASSFGLRPASQVIADENFAWKFLDINKTKHTIDYRHSIDCNITSTKTGDVLI